MDHKWSTEQQAIFDWFAKGSGHCVVRARAGTGKTTTILEAINFAPERKILLAAFNKSIADELAQRLRSPKASAKTLHGVGFSFVRKAWGGKLRVDNRSRKIALAEAVLPIGKIPYRVKRTVAELGTKIRELAPWLVKQDEVTALDTIQDLALIYELTIAHFSDDGEADHKYTDEDAARWALQTMHVAMERTDVIDFADMLFLPLAHSWVTPTHDLVVVDEAQDMSAAQLLIAQQCCRGRICVVGDDRQAIYGFRGADSRSLDRLKATLQARELGLKTTYRCPQAVVALAQQIVPDFVAAPSAPEGIVRRQLDALDTLLRGAEPGDFVLSRTNAPLAYAALQLLKAGKPARIQGRDMSKGLRKICEQAQNSGAKNLGALVARLGIIAASECRRLQKQVDAGQLDQEMADAAAERTADTHEVLRALCDGLDTFEELFDRMDRIFTDDQRGVVLCSTVHRAKGLEADRVWLLEKTFLRTKRDDNKPSAEGDDAYDPYERSWRKGREEQNIRYVAITRAKHELVWLVGDLEDK